MFHPQNCIRMDGRFVFEGEITDKVTCKKCGRKGMDFKTAVQNRCTKGGFHEVLRQN